MISPKSSSIAPLQSSCSPAVSALRRILMTLATSFALGTPMTPVSSAAAVDISVENLVSVRGSGHFDSVAMSPDGQWIAFQLEHIDSAKNLRTLDLYVTASDGRASPRQLTHNLKMAGSALSPRWSPDSRTLAYFSDNGAEPGLWITTIADFVSRPLKLNLPVLAGIDGTRAGNLPAGLKWSPDGQFLAFTAGASETPAEEQALHGVRVDLEWLGEWTRAKAARLCTVRPATAETQCLTPPSLNVLDFDWAPDASRLAITAAGDASYSSYMRADLYIVDRKTGALRSLVAMPGREAQPMWSPDGRWIAFLTQNGVEDWLQQAWPAVVSVDGGSPRFLGDEWRAMSNAGAKLLRWSPGGNALYFSGSLQFSYHLFKLSVRTGAVERLTPDTTHLYRSFSFSGDGSRIAYTRESPVQPQEIYTATMQPFAERKVFTANPEFEKFTRPSVELVSWPSSDGKWQVQAAVLRPADFRKDKRYPLVVWVQGGPGMATLEFNFTNQYPALLLAQRGYVVLAINTRGRPGYGKDFHEALGSERSMGVNGVQDVLDGVDLFIRRGEADPERLGMMGLSYGGYLTSLAPALTHRFKALSAGDPLLDIVGGRFNSGISAFAKLSRHMQGLDHPYSPEHLQLAIEQSPLHRTHQMRTPIYLECGVNSSLAAGCRMFYHALQHHRVPSMLIMYPRSGHGLTEPALLMDAYRRNLAWFDYWLQGKGANPLDAGT